MKNPYKNLAKNELDALLKINADDNTACKLINEVLAKKFPPYKGGSFKPQEIQLITEGLEGALSFITGLDQSRDAGKLEAEKDPAVIKARAALKNLARFKK
jgi:hypothetical protein